MVASQLAVGSQPERSHVSIPFIAGQWSLRVVGDLVGLLDSLGFNPLHCGAVVASRGLSDHTTGYTLLFQSPSLRGSGRFFCSGVSWAIGFFSFNPLHCGAVVASGRRKNGHRDRNVSIPFIAGQWSLLINLTDRPSLTNLFQSPSLRGSGRFGDR